MTVLVTTRDAEGCMHSRAMSLASRMYLVLRAKLHIDIVPDDGLHFLFVSDITSAKQDEINTVDQVNISFLEPSSTSWVSVCGTAQINQDPEQIKKLWNPMVSAWFGDLGDGVHKGDASDPRVCVIKVIPSSVSQHVHRKISF